MKSGAGLAAFAVNDIADAEEKARLHGEAEAALRDVRLIADLIIGASISTAGDDRDRSLGQLDAELERLAPLIGQALDPDRPESARANARNALAGRGRELLDAGKPEARPPRRCFHWPLEFPEVFNREPAGFDAVVGNPPFQYGTIVATEQGATYTSFLKSYFSGWHGKSDMVAAFFRKAETVVSRSGIFGLIATASLLRGETLDSGLKHLVRGGLKIFFARRPFKWPGTAGADVVVIGLSSSWHAKCLLDGSVVKEIGVELSEQINRVEPKELLNETWFGGGLGVKLSPSNFELKRAEYGVLTSDFPQASCFMRPVLGGEEIQNLWDFDASPVCVDPDQFKKWRSEHHGMVHTAFDVDPNHFRHSRPAEAVLDVAHASNLVFACAETVVHLIFVCVHIERFIVKQKAVIFHAEDWGSVFYSTIELSPGLGVETRSSACSGPSLQS